jgi:hypothetical protein
MNILPVGAELFHAGERASRRTYRHDEANSRFQQFCEHDCNLFPYVVPVDSLLILRITLKIYMNCVVKCSFLILQQIVNTRSLKQNPAATNICQN